MKENGTGLMQLTTDAGPLVFEVHQHWSPDGTQAILDSRRDGNGDLRVVKADGPGPQKLTTHSAADTHPDWRYVP